MAEYVVSVDQSPEYDVGVNYEIPSKSIQNANLILDHLNSQFDGSKTLFALTHNNNVYAPINDQQIIVVKNNLVLEPLEDYNISGSNIQFAVAPTSTDDVFIIALQYTADLTRTVNFIVDSGSADMNTGLKGSLTLDVTGTIEHVQIMSDQVGSVQVEIKKSDYSSFPTSNSITNSQYISISNGQIVRDDTLNNWDNIIRSGDILQFEVISVSNIRRFLISLKLNL
jgi:hypothetical protein